MKAFSALQQEDSTNGPPPSKYERREMEQERTNLTRTLKYLSRNFMKVKTALNSDIKKRG